MEPNELTTYRGLGEVRNYGIFVLITLCALNIATLAGLIWFEKNDLKHELASMSDTLPSFDATKPEQTIYLPDNFLALHVTALEKIGFYEIKADKDYLAYANPKNNYIIMKSEKSINHEVQNFALVLGGLYVAEVILILGWWFFLRTKLRELFEIA